MGTGVVGIRQDLLELCRPAHRPFVPPRSEEHTSELQSRLHLVCRLLLEKIKGVVDVSLAIAALRGQGFFHLVDAGQFRMHVRETVRTRFEMIVLLFTDDEVHLRETYMPG